MSPAEIALLVATAVLSGAVSGWVSGAQASRRFTQRNKHGTNVIGGDSSHNAGRDIVSVSSNLRPSSLIVQEVPDGGFAGTKRVLVNVGDRPALNVRFTPGGPYVRWLGTPGQTLDAGEQVIVILAGLGGPGSGRVEWDDPDHGPQVKALH